MSLKSEGLSFVEAIKELNRDILKIHEDSGFLLVQRKNPSYQTGNDQVRIGLMNQMLEITPCEFL